MMKIQNAQKLAAAVACLAMLFSPAAMAAQPVVAPLSDISLQAGGLLVGHVVDAKGLAVAKSPVAILRGGKEIVRTETDQTGKFSVEGLKGGVYEVATAQHRGVYRFWAPHTAPPSAQPRLMIASSGDVVRGQGYGRPAGNKNPFQVAGEWVTKHPFMTAGIVAAAIAIPIALDDDDDPIS